MGGPGIRGPGAKRTNELHELDVGNEIRSFTIIYSYRGRWSGSVAGSRRSQPFL